MMPTIAGLSILQVIAAVIVGLSIAFVATFAMASHPVEVPVQVITPVPTPPPVVITQPTPVPVQTSQPSSSCNGSGGFPWWLAMLIFGIPMVMVVFLLGFNGGEGGLVMAVIGSVVLAMTFMIASMILDAIVCALTVIP